jgi:hypothetical protein
MPRRFAGIPDGVGLGRAQPHLTLVASEHRTKDPRLVELPGRYPAWRDLQVETAAVRMHAGLGVPDLCRRQPLNFPRHVGTPVACGIYLRLYAGA